MEPSPIDVDDLHVMTQMDDLIQYQHMQKINDRPTKVVEIIVEVTLLESSPYESHLKTIVADGHKT